MVQDLLYNDTLHNFASNTGQRNDDDNDDDDGDDDDDTTMLQCYETE